MKEPDRIYITWEGSIILEWTATSCTPATVMTFNPVHATEASSNPIQSFFAGEIGAMRFEIGTLEQPQEVLLQGNLHHGINAHGHTLNGNSVYGSTTNGYTIFGSTTHGRSVFGDTIDGSTVYGNTVNGTTVFGDTTEGQTFFGSRVRRNELVLYM
ncbi:hypothetical protein N7468_002241 [Penicillium chermesinum]|uniref:Uncharacterized protein n=1 Tax=Penicillium chermesinum TaxID=63820 RepID=A0A9W9PKA1_9EURO|nr:uncharacterized protein N7468_002241 [Penicillium chermesinum]KAJ5247258.1 hypothetical protein N7468_002241 [Penicillium chermesinum]